MYEISKVIVELTCASARMRRIKAKVGCVVRSSSRASASPSLFKRFKVLRAETEYKQPHNVIWHNGYK